MRGYLFDTNILDYWFDDHRPEHENVIRRMNAIDPHSPLRISAISLGEIEYGHRCVSAADTAIQLTFKEFVATRLPRVLTVDRSTSVHYGQIRARLFRKFAAKNDRKSLRTCQLVDPVTERSLGIQENDLWIAAQASEFNLVLVTHDRMERIRDVASDLLVVEDWAA